VNASCTITTVIAISRGSSSRRMRHAPLPLSSSSSGGAAAGERVMHHYHCHRHQQGEQQQENASCTQASADWTAFDTHQPTCYYATMPNHACMVTTISTSSRSSRMCMRTHLLYPHTCSPHGHARAFSTLMQNP